NLSSMQEHRERSYALDSGLANILIYVIVFLVVITSVGILGLASFSVSRRTKQIGIRRALGATRTDVLRYFLLENLLITSVGVLLGAALTVALNIALVDALNFPKIHWASVPIGMLVLLLLGQLAVLGPARRASNIAPAVATRTV
ncbi:MAG: FtsX-like permease family protein, partial [Pseudomonadota bacterium]